MNWIEIKQRHLTIIGYYTNTKLLYRIWTFHLTQDKRNKIWFNGLTKSKKYYLKKELRHTSINKVKRNFDYTTVEVQLSTVSWNFRIHSCSLAYGSSSPNYPNQSCNKIVTFVNKSLCWDQRLTITSSGEVINNCVSMSSIKKVMRRPQDVNELYPSESQLNSIVSRIPD